MVRNIVILMVLVAVAVAFLVFMAVRRHRNGGAVSFTISRMQFIIAAGVWGLLAAGLVIYVVVKVVNGIKSDSPAAFFLSSMSPLFIICIALNAAGLVLLTMRALAKGTYNPKLQWLDWIFIVFTAPVEFIFVGIRLAFAAARELFGF